MICNKVGVGERMCAKKGLRNRTMTNFRQGEKSGLIHFDIFIVQRNVISFMPRSGILHKMTQGKTGG
jgi:hypothetical protein